MSTDLLRSDWAKCDSADLRLLLDEHVGGPGQYDDIVQRANTLSLPLAGEACKIVLTFGNDGIASIEPGSAFDPLDWERISKQIDQSLLGGPTKIGREYSFSRFRVLGSWRGRLSNVQVLPPPADAPRAQVEIAAHPFILEFPIRASDWWPLTNLRRMREHRRLTLLLNAILIGRVGFQSNRSDHVWATECRDGAFESKWLQQSFFAPLGAAVNDELSAPASESLVELEPQEYFAAPSSHSRSLRVPADLDEWISRYGTLADPYRAMFDRALFWFDRASALWPISVSASFAALVSAIESLTERGVAHRFKCPVCKGPTQHERPGATRRFKNCLERYAPGAPDAKRRDNMYSLRSGILHGSALIQLDQDLTFGWDPPWWNQWELHRELWRLTKTALRNWLATAGAG